LSWTGNKFGCTEAYWYEWFLRAENDGGNWATIGKSNGVSFGVGTGEGLAVVQGLTVQRSGETIRYGIELKPNGGLGWDGGVDERLGLRTDCGDGQIIKRNSAGEWLCAADNDTFGQASAQCSFNNGGLTLGSGWNYYNNDINNRDNTQIWRYGDFVFAHVILRWGASGTPAAYPGDHQLMFTITNRACRPGVPGGKGSDQLEYETRYGTIIVETGGDVYYMYKYGPGVTAADSFDGEGGTVRFDVMWKSTFAGF
jgi:hypothetical protein